MMLYDLLPHHLPRVGRVLRLRFAYSVAYYPLLALLTFTGLALPPSAVISGRPWMNIDYFQFLGHLAALGVWPLLLTMMLRRRRLLRPPSAPLLSWESALFVLTRWPYVAWGVLAATLHTIRPRAITFKVTPKNRSGLEPLPTRLIVPYLIIAVVLAGFAWVGESRGAMAGYVFLCVLGASSYAIVATAVPVLHVVEAARTSGVPAVRAARTALVPLLVGASSLVPLALAAIPYPGYAIRVFGW
jgi:hypothetical protein